MLDFTVNEMCYKTGRVRTRDYKVNLEAQPGIQILNGL